MNPKEEARNLMLLHFNAIHSGNDDLYDSHNLYNFHDCVLYETPQYHDCKAAALVTIESHIYSENDSPFFTMSNWIQDNKYWHEVKKELEKI